VGRLGFERFYALAMIVHSIDVLGKRAIDLVDFFRMLGLRVLHRSKAFVDLHEVTGNNVEASVDPLQFGPNTLERLLHRRELLVKELIELFDFVVCHLGGLSHVENVARQASNLQPIASS